MAYVQKNRFKKSTGYIQDNNPNPVTSCGRRRSPLTNKAKGMDGKALLERIQTSWYKKERW
jgi:hypothetical protein